MEFPRNSVWELKGSDLAEDGLYRVLDIMHDVASVVLFPLNTESSTSRPLVFSMEAFIEHIKIDAQSADFDIVKGMGDYINKVLYLTVECNTIDKDCMDNH